MVTTGKKCWMHGGVSNDSACEGGASFAGVVIFKVLVFHRLKSLSGARCRFPKWHDLLIFAGNNIHSPISILTRMANTGKTVATLLIGAAVGAAVGYVLATDKDSRAETVDKLKEKLSTLQDTVKQRFSKKAQDLEEEIYNA